MKGDIYNSGNYRPSAFLPVISEVFERFIYEKLRTLLDGHKIIYDVQHGFR